MDGQRFDAIAGPIAPGAVRSPGFMFASSLDRGLSGHARATQGRRRRRQGAMKSFRRAFVIGLVVIQILGVIGWRSNDASAQDGTATYTDPNGRYTMQWQAPWEIVRQDETVTMLSNGGTALLIPLGSFPIGTTNLDSCLPALANLAGDSNETSYPVLAEGQTTWRSWIAYQNDSVGLADYFECQILPDGEAMAAFVGGASLSNFSVDIEQLTDFAGRTIIQPNGEHAPALTRDGWRAGIVKWSRGTVYKDLGLSAKDGKEWVIAVVDITNQQAADEEISLKSFAVRDVSKSGLNKASTRDSNSAAAALGEAPRDGASALMIPVGTTSRAVLVFIVSESAKELAFSFAGQELLASSDGLARFGILHPPTWPVRFETATVNKAIDGRTLSVTLNESGDKATVQLIGLDVPVKDECFAPDSKKQLAKLAGASILLETDDAVSDDDPLPRHVWSEDGSVLLSNELVRLGFATATTDGHRFQAMLSASEAQARDTSKGLWASCQTTAQETPTPTTEASSPPTASDRAYLSSLQERFEILDLSLTNLDGLLQDGNIDDQEINQLAWIFIGLGTVEKGIRGAKPPARYESLQGAYLSALEPLTTQARAEADLDSYIYGDASTIDFYGLEIDAEAMSAALERTTALLAEADAQFEAAQTEAS